MQKQVLDALAQDTSADGFTQLIWSNDSGRQAVSERRAAKAKQLRRDFLEQVEKVVPDTVLCSAVFSPHALIDEIYANLEYAGNVNKIFEMMLPQGPFLFREISDSLRPKGQISFAELYLNKSNIFQFQQKDYSFALDFAIGLGIAGDTAAFFSRIVSYMEDDGLIAKYLPSRTLYHARRVKQLYQSAGQIIELPISELLSRIREAVQRFTKEISSEHWCGEDTVEKLHCQSSDSLRLSSEQLQHNLVSSSVLYGIHTVDDLIFKIAKIFVRTLNGSRLRLDMLNDGRFSAQQLSLIQSNISLIGDGLQKTTSDAYNIVQQRRQETIEILQRNSICTDRIPKTMLNSCKCRIDEWPFAGFTDNQSWKKAQSEIIRYHSRIL